MSEDEQPEQEPDATAEPSAPAGSEAHADTQAESGGHAQDRGAGTDEEPRADGGADPERRGGERRGDEQAPVESDRRSGLERRVSTVDFSQPTKFATEIRQRIVRALETFCEAFSVRLAGELGSAAELRIADCEQRTWSAARAQLPADAIALALEVEPIERQMLLNLDPPVLLRALECLLGGSASQAPAERRLTDVDWAIARPLLEAMTAQLSAAWRDLGGLELSLGEIDLEGDADVAAPQGEPTFAVVIEVRIGELPANISLLIPWSAIAPVAEEILSGGAGDPGGDAHDGATVHRGLAGANVLLRAEVGSTRIPVEQMLALAPGTLLELEDSAKDGVQVFAERVPLARAHPGLRGTRRAIKLITAVEPARPGLSAAPALPANGRSALISDPQQPDGASANADGGNAEGSAPQGANARVLTVPVRVSAELGRTSLPLGSALELPPGAVLELDQGAEAPIELFANGKSFARGALQVSGEGRWAVQIQTLC